MLIPLQNYTLSSNWWYVTCVTSVAADHCVKDWYKKIKQLFTQLWHYADNFIMLKTYKILNFTKWVKWVAMKIRPRDPGYFLAHLVNLFISIKIHLQIKFHNIKLSTKEFFLDLRESRPNIYSLKNIDQKFEKSKMFYKNCYSWYKKMSTKNVYLVCPPIYFWPKSYSSYTTSIYFT